MRRPSCLFPAVCVGLFVCSLMAGTAGGQMLRFDNYRDFVVPDNANIRIGNFYSDWSMAQSVGVRDVRTSGAGGDILYANGLGQIKKDGVEFPLVSTLNLKNYLLINKYIDLDLSCSLTYSLFPNRTEDNQFNVGMLGQGISAQMGSFSMNATRDSLNGAFNGNNATAAGYTSNGGSDKGFSANLSSEFDLSPFVKGRVFDNPAYSVSYVDERGRTDLLRGSQYRYLQNAAGLNLDWLMAKDKDLAFTVTHTDTWPLDSQFDNTRSSVNAPSLIYQQQISPIFLVGARGDWSWSTFDTNVRGDQSQQDYTGFMGFDLSDDSQLRAGVGYSLATLSNPGTTEQAGDSGAVVGYVSLRSMLTERTANSIGYTRRQSSGFGSGVEVTDEYRDAITWHNDDWSWSFLTSYAHVQPRLAEVSDYTDWINQLGVTRSLTETLTALANVAYTVRHNGPLPQNELNTSSIFVSNDYHTWAVNLGLSQKLTDHVTLFYYVEHLVEAGDTASLDFDRDTVGVTLTYQHDF